MEKNCKGKKILLTDVLCDLDMYVQEDLRKQEGHFTATAAQKYRFVRFA